MARTYREVETLCLCIFVMLLLVNFGKSDITKDKEECANQLAGLATCLPYVGGEAKAPTLDCCTGLKQVVKDSKKCLCILVKDRNDPSLGLKINATLALGLPETCHAPATVSECPALLHLPPNSPDAKVFTDFAEAAAPVSSTSPTSSGNSTGSGSKSAKEKSDGGKRLVAQVMYGVLLWCLTSHFIF